MKGNLKDDVASRYILLRYIKEGTQNEQDKDSMNIMVG